MKNKLVNHIWNIMSKRHGILPTRTSFFILNAGETETMQKFEIKLFE